MLVRSAVLPLALALPLLRVEGIWYYLPTLPRQGEGDFCYGLTVGLLGVYRGQVRSYRSMNYTVSWAVGRLRRAMVQNPNTACCLRAV